MWLAIGASRDTQAFQKPHFLYRRVATFCLGAFMVVGLLQLIPVPAVLLKLVSPNTIRVLEKFQDSIPLLTTISFAPADTLHQWMQIGSIVLCCSLLAYLEFGLSDVRELLLTIVLSGLVLIACGGVFYWAVDMLSSHSLDFLIPLRRRLTFYAGMCLPVSMSILLSRIGYIGSRRGFVPKFIQAVKEDSLVWGYAAVPLMLFVFLIITSVELGFLAVLIPALLYLLVLSYLRMAKPLRRKLRYVFVTMGILLIMSGLFRSFSMSVGASEARDITPGQWDIAGEIISDFPLLGAGLGTFPFVARLYSFQYEGLPPSHAGGDYIEAAAEMGMIAAIFLFAFFAVLIVGMTRMWWSRRHPDVKLLGLGVLCGILVGLMHSIFHSSLHVPPQLFLLGLFVVIGIKIVTYKKNFPAE